jgi:osmoprotectant transport system permease protein
MTWLLGHLDDVAWALGQHALLVAVSVGIAFTLALGAGVWASHRPRVRAVVMAATALLYTIPSLALFALLIPVLGLGRGPAVAGLVAYALLVLVRNVATGLAEVDADVVEAARGMGLSRWQVLTRIEIPLALPVIVAGLRVATVTVIGIATIAAYVNAGGLGLLIFTGIQQSHPAKIWVGAGLASAMAIAVDLGLVRLEHRLRERRAA